MTDDTKQVDLAFASEVANKHGYVLVRRGALQVLKAHHMVPAAEAREHPDAVLPDVTQRLAALLAGRIATDLADEVSWTPSEDGQLIEASLSVAAVYPNRTEPPVVTVKPKKATRGANKPRTRR